MKCLCILSFLIITTFCTDLLNGNGKFNDASNINNWKWVNQTAYTNSIITNGTDGYLTLTKIVDSVFSYDDGMYYYFGDSNPQHIHFEILTYEGIKETGDFRLVYLDSGKLSSNSFSKYDNSDSIFFRFGFYNFIRVNLEDLVYSFEPIRWYIVDLLLNWDDQKVAIFIGGQYTLTVDFFYSTNNIPKCNAIMIYNLTPNSKIKLSNLQICTTKCSGYETLIYSAAWYLSSIGIIFCLLMYLCMFLL